MCVLACARMRPPLRERMSVNEMSHGLPAGRHAAEDFLNTIATPYLVTTAAKVFVLKHLRNCAGEGVARVWRHAVLKRPSCLFGNRGAHAI